MGIFSLIIAAIGLLTTFLFGHFPGINKLTEGTALIKNDHSVLWSILGYALLAVGLGAAAFYYL